MSCVGVLQTMSVPEVIFLCVCRYLYSGEAVLSVPEVIFLYVQVPVQWGGCAADHVSA